MTQKTSLTKTMARRTVATMAGQIDATSTIEAEAAVEVDVGTAEVAAAVATRTAITAKTSTSSIYLNHSSHADPYRRNNEFENLPETDDPTEIRNQVWPHLCASLLLH